LPGAALSAIMETMEQIDVTRMTLEEYLVSEPSSEIKREFVNGEVIAMAGASLPHNTIASNVAGLLFNALKGSPCRAYGSDLRICVEATGLFAYPDVTICCEKPRLLPNVRPDTVTNPQIVFEILSSSTESWDRGAKLAHYRRLPSLREVILIAQDEIRIEHYVRQADQRWLLHGDWIGADSGPLTLVNPPVTLPLAAVYDGVEVQ
jgi:Uma2 family endonuclease